MRAVPSRAFLATTLAIALVLWGSRWLVPVRADDPAGPTLLGKYVRVTFGTSPTPGRDGIVTDVLGTTKAVDAVGIHLDSTQWMYENADNANQQLAIFVPWASVLFVTVMPPEASKD